MPETETSPKNPELDEVFGGYQYHTELLTQTYHETKSAFGLDVIEKQRDELVSDVHKLELKSQRLKLKHDEMARHLESQSNRAKRRSLLVWVLSLAALILFGMGINYVTGDNQAAHTPGGVMIVFAVVLESLGLWIARLWPD